jgi:hypothetical protein
VYKNGDTVKLDFGSYEGKAEGRGYATTYPIIEVDSGTIKVQDLTRDLVLSSATATTAPSAPIVAPQLASSRPTGGNSPAAVADSGELRLQVTPNTAKIWVDDREVGEGKKFHKTHVGGHDVRFTATGCTTVTRRLEVKKGESTIHNETLNCPNRSPL